MNRHRWIQISSALAAAGGAAWLVKFAVIGATDGGTGGGATAAFYLLGVALMLVGATWVGARATARLATPLFALGVVLSPVVLFASYAALEGLAKGIVGDAGPAWLEEEIGIAATGAFWLLASVWSRRAAVPARRYASATPGSTMPDS
jgi:hypothetical protein